MKKTVIFLSLITSLLIADNDSKAILASEKALSALDCEFEDCSEPKVIIKEVPIEKIVYKERIVYKDKIIIKEVPVEKIVYKDKVIIKKVPIEKIVYRDKPINKITEITKVKPTNIKKSQLDKWEEEIFYLMSENLKNNKIYYIPKLMEPIKTNLYFENNFMPLKFNSYSDFGNIKIIMKEKLKNYDVFIEYKGIDYDYEISIGKVRFFVAWKDINGNTVGTVKVMGSNPVVIYDKENNIDYWKDITKFRVVSKGSITTAYYNDKLVYTDSVNNYPLRAISVNAKRVKKGNDKIYEIGIIKLVKK